MFDPKFFQELANKVADAMPPQFNEMRKDLEKSLQALLQQTFTKLDLITREEFAVQIEVLKRTRLKLEKLEHQVKDLEAQLAVQQHKKGHK